MGFWDVVKAPIKVPWKVIKWPIVFVGKQSLRIVLPKWLRPYRELIVKLIEWIFAGAEVSKLRTLSPAGSLSLEDLWAVLRGGVIAGIGALLTYVTEAIPGVDLGMWTPLVVAAWSFLANVIRKWIEGPPTPPVS